MSMRKIVGFAGTEDNGNSVGLSGNRISGWVAELSTLVPFLAINQFNNS